MEKRVGEKSMLFLLPSNSETGVIAISNSRLKLFMQTCRHQLLRERIKTDTLSDSKPALGTKS